MITRRVLTRESLQRFHYRAKPVALGPTRTRRWQLRSEERCWQGISLLLRWRNFSAGFNCCQAQARGGNDNLGIAAVFAVGEQHVSGVSGV